MKTINENLCSIISGLDIVCRALDTLKKNMEIATPLVVVDDYFRILFAFQQIKGVIEVLKGVVKEAKSSPSTT
jgi:16S rRNA G527 N7-methylase RsmG